MPDIPRTSTRLWTTAPCAPPLRMPFARSPSCWDVDGPGNWRWHGINDEREENRGENVQIYFRRNNVYASWKPDKASISVNRGSHFQVHFVWQVCDGQLSPAFKSIRLKAVGGWKFDPGTTKLHARILWGKGAQKMMKPNMFTVRSSASATPLSYQCVTAQV